MMLQSEKRSRAKDVKGNNGETISGMHGTSMLVSWTVNTCTFCELRSSLKSPKLKIDPFWLFTNVSGAAYRDVDIGKAKKDQQHRAGYGEKQIVNGSVWLGTAS
ncbi:hypothetical protein T03_4068 [Trichinella britovi]|uniref:Uncharacterized protein n=1 Tax=Trichinella britovi TaxID=45882 RepID=A0A0V1DB78_TRIBR|nr:hypothetical protein T06_9258 [Trichinella sp. T6]KRY58893.1 hypothetical protein T03_4068 [Trichinella britovi]